MAGYGRIEDIFIQVNLRAGEAKEELEKIKSLGEKAQKPIKDEINKLQKKIQLREAYLQKTKEEQKAMRELLKLDGRRVLNEAQSAKVQEKIVKLKEKIAAENEKIESSELYKNIQQENAELEKQAEIIGVLNDRRKAGLRDYIEFTKRASSENGRFADRLDRRDRTRSLAENLRRGMEKGTAISQRWHAEENAVYRLERSLGIASTAFDRVRHPAEAMTDAFYRFQRIGYTVQTVLGVLVGTIGDIVAGMMALVGVASAAAGSLIAVAGAFANLAAGMVTAKFALSGVGAAVQKLWQGQTDYNRALADAKKRFRDLRFEAEEAALSEQEAAIALEKARENLARVQDLPADNRARREAELEFQRAELNYRRAKARVKDTKDELKRGPARNASQDPFNNLTKSQIAFAKYLATLKPVVQSLKEAAASSFLPPLQKSIQVLVDNLVPALKDGLNSVGEALGDASRNFTDAFKDKENIKLFREFLENSKPTIRLLGAIANKAFGGILVILKAAQPITDRFARWVFAVVDGFEKWAKSGGEDTLRKFFKLAGDVSSELGKGFKLIFGGLSNIVKATFPNGANSGAGGVILQWLKEIGAGFKVFTGQKGFSDFLKNATENAKVALGTVGQFLKIFLDLAANPANKEFWMEIRNSVPYVRKILEDGQKAGPAFAKLLNAILELISNLSESTAIQVFFTTLQLSANAISNILKAIKPLLDLLGILHGAFLALALVGVLFRKAIQIMMGIMMKLFRVAGFVSTSFQNFRAKLVAAKAEGRTGFKGILDSLQQIKLEMTNLKRIELLKTVAKGNLDKKIADIRDQMSRLNLRTKAGRDEAARYELQIKKLNAAYRALRGELEQNGKAAKRWSDLTKESLASAALDLQKFTAQQDKMAKFGRVVGRVGVGAMAVGTAASTLQSGTMGGLGGVGAGISAVGAGLSFIPGWGLAAGIGTSIIGSIVSGFEQANAEKKAQEEQKKVEINAKLAEIRAEKLQDTTTAVGALVGRGATYAAATTRVTAFQDAATLQMQRLGVGADKVDIPKLVSSLLTSETLGAQAAKVGGTQPLTDAVLKLVSAGESQESAIARVEQVFSEGYGGKTGIDAVKEFITKSGAATTKIVQDSTTGKVTTETVTPEQRAAAAKKQAQIDLAKANGPLMFVLKNLQSTLTNEMNPTKRNKLITQIQDKILEIQANNEKFSPIAGKATDVSWQAQKFLGRQLPTGIVKDGKYTSGFLTTGKGMDYFYTPVRQEGIDPKVRIHFDNAEELSSLTNTYLKDLLTEVKNNPKKTSITLKDSKGKIIGTYDIETAVGGAGIG